MLTAVLSVRFSTQGDDEARAELLVFACRGCRTRADAFLELDSHVESCEVKNSGG